MDEDLNSDLCTHRIWLPLCCNPIVVLGEDSRITGVPRLLVRETLSEANKAENDWVPTRCPLLASTLLHTWGHALPVPNIHYPTERDFCIAKAKLGRGGKPPIGKKNTCEPHIYDQVMISCHSVNLWCSPQACILNVWSPAGLFRRRNYLIGGNSHRGVSLRDIHSPWSYLPSVLTVHHEMKMPLH